MDMTCPGVQKPTLVRVVFDERFLHRMKRAVLRDALDRLDAFALNTRPRA
jgi:hypothetical protein